MHSSSPDFNEDFASEFEKTKKALESLNFDVQQKKTFLAQNKSPASVK